MPRHPGGRPTKYDKKFHTKDFVDKSKQGKSITQIARDWDLARETLYDWGRKYPEFSDALKKGREFCEGWYTDLGQAAMLGQAKVGGKAIQFNLGAFVWMTKNVLKWSDKVEQKTEVSGEIMTGVQREETMRKMFSDEKSKGLALELVEAMEAKRESDK